MATKNESNHEIFINEQFETKGAIKIASFEQDKGRTRFARAGAWGAVATASASGNFVGGALGKNLNGGSAL